MKTNSKLLLVRFVTCIFLLFSALYMYDFYKCLSGFIANGFREPLVMLPMILAFFLPVLCFLFFFYDFYVSAIHPALKTASSIFVAIYTATDLALIFANIHLYKSNNALGVYDSLPSIILHFPYDMIVVLSAIFIWQIFNLAVAGRKGTRAGEFLALIKQRGTLNIGKLEYVALCVMAIIVFVFTGAGLYAAFSAFGNAFYDFRYVFLILWVMLIPMVNLLLLTLKPEKMNIPSRTKLVTLGVGVASNILFGILFLIFELTYPDFLVHIGKPLFLITFSVSLPIEPAIIIAIMALGTALMTVRFFKTVKGREIQMLSVASEATSV